MSFRSARLQSALFSGLDATPPPEGAVPVLFGTRFINRPRVIWYKSTNVPRNEVPAVLEKQSKVNTDTTTNRPFVMIVALCAGVLDECHSLWNEGRRLPQLGGSSYLLGRPGYSAEFSDEDFFSGELPLSGFCYVLDGDLDQDGLYDPPNTPYMRGYLDNLPSGASSELHPKDGKIFYRGTAIAHLYVWDQGSDNFGDWSWLCTRQANASWRPDSHRIKIDQTTLRIEHGNDVRARHHVLAIDCSSVNGIPVQPSPDATTSISPGVSTVLTRVEHYQGGYETGGRNLTVNRQIVQFRYDIIRQGAVAALQNLLDEFRAARETRKQDYAGSLEVVLFWIDHTSSGTPTLTESVRVTYEADDGSTQSTRRYEFNTRNLDEATRYIEKLQETLEKHPRLKTEPHHPDEVPGISPDRTTNRFYNSTRGRSGLGWFPDFRYNNYYPPELINRSTNPDTVLGINYVPVNENYKPFNNYTDMDAFYDRNRSVYTPEYVRRGTTRNARRTISPLDSIFAYDRASTEEVFDYVMRNNPHFRSLNVNKLPQISFILGPNWPGLTACAMLYVPPYSQSTGVLSYWPTIPTVFEYHLIGRTKTFISEGGVRAAVSDFPWSFLESYYGGPFSVLTRYGITRSNIVDRHGNRLMSWDYQVLDPWVWGPTSRDSFQSYGNSDRPLMRVRMSYTRWNLAKGTQYVHGISSNGFPTLRTLTSAGAQINENVELFDALNANPDFDFYDPDGGNAQGSDYVLPGNDEKKRFSEVSKQVYRRNCVSSLGSEPGRYLGEIGNRMGVVRTKVYPQDVNKQFYGANPVHIVRECLLHPIWGGGRGGFITEDQIDETSFGAAADIVFRENMGLGFLWDRQRPLTEFINNVLAHIDALIYQEGFIFKMRLLGASEYDNVLGWKRNPVGMTVSEYLNALVFDESKIMGFSSIRIPREDQLVNRITVKYTPYYSTKVNSATNSHEDRIRRFGLKAKSVTYDGILDKDTALKVAARDLSLESAGLLTATVRVFPETASGLLPGDIIRVEWKELNIDAVYCRVLRIIKSSTESNSVSLDLIQAQEGDIIVRA